MLCFRTILFYLRAQTESRRARAAQDIPSPTSRGRASITEPRVAATRQEDSSCGGSGYESHSTHADSPIRSPLRCSPGIGEQGADQSARKGYSHHPVPLRHFGPPRSRYAACFTSRRDRQTSCRSTRVDSICFVFSIKVARAINLVKNHFVKSRGDRN